jgi:hypothetical protein
MSGRPSFAIDLPLGLSAREVKASCIGWGVYMVALSCYCMVHHVVVSASAPDMPGSVIWAVRDWGIWLLITPVALRSLRQYDSLTIKQRVSLFRSGVLILLVSVAVRVADGYLTYGQGIAETTVIYLPRYVAALIGIALVWHMFLRKRTAVAEAESASSGNPGRQCPPTLLVSKGSDECLIQVDRIQCISAAGNYVEVYCDGKLYLLRSTMKTLEEGLPPPMFLRIHRSHIVNVNEIDRIRTRASGNGTVQLHCGKTLRISKKYRSRLQRYRTGLA